MFPIQTYHSCATNCLFFPYTNNTIPFFASKKIEQNSNWLPKTFHTAPTLQVTQAGLTITKFPLIFSACNNSKTDWSHDKQLNSCNNLGNHSKNSLPHSSRSDHWYSDHRRSSRVWPGRQGHDSTHLGHCWPPIESAFRRRYLPPWRTCPNYLLKNEIVINQHMNV